VQRLINRLGWVVACALGIAIVTALSGVVRGGPLDPPGAPAPTLPQIQPRSPIPPVGWDGLTWPIVISQPGSYYLTRSLAVNSTVTSAIQITASDVTLDLNGFTLDGINAGCPGHGIDIAAVVSDLTVRNGTLRRWCAAIQAAGNVSGYATQSRYEDLLVTDNAAGIRADSGSVIEKVTVERSTGTGIRVTDSGNLYLGGVIEDCLATGNYLGINVQANNVTVRRCIIDSSTTSAVAVGTAFDVIEDNTIQGTNTGPGVSVSGCCNTVTRNIFANLFGGAVSNSGAGNRIGPSDTTLAGTQPWSNAGP
jgi:hypothetical protein